MGSISLLTLLSFTLLLLGYHCSAADSITKVIRSKLKTGQSLEGRTVESLQNKDFHIRTSGSVENYSKWELKLVACETVDGRFSGAYLSSVAAGTREGFSSINRAPLSATGIFIRCTWSVNTTTLVHIMYSVPFDRNLYDNWMALAVCAKSDHTCKTLDAHDMYYNNYPFIVRRKYVHHLIPAKICRQSFCIIGLMTSLITPVQHIRFYPASFYDLEDSMQQKCVKEKLGSKEYQKFIKLQFT